MWGSADKGHMKDFSLAAPAMVGVVVLLGSSTGCMSYEDREVEHRTAQKQELADFAKRHHATPVQLLPDWEGLGEELPRTFTAQLQERIEGSTVAFRGELVDVVRTSGDNYQLVFGNLIDGGIATLNFDRQGAKKLMDDPPDLYSDLLVAARIDKVELTFDIWTGPQFRVFGTAVAIARCTDDRARDNPAGEKAY